MGWAGAAKGTVDLCVCEGVRSHPSDELVLLLKLDPSTSAKHGPRLAAAKARPSPTLPWSYHLRRSYHDIVVRVATMSLHNIVV